MAQKEPAAGQLIGEIAERAIAKVTADASEQIVRFRLARNDEHVGAEFALQPMGEGEPASRRPVLPGRETWEVDQLP